MGEGAASHGDDDLRVVLRNNYYSAHLQPFHSKDLTNFATFDEEAAKLSITLITVEN